MAVKINKLDDEKQEELQSLFAVIFMAIFVLIPFLLLIAVVTADIYNAPLGRALGISLGDTEHLRIYEVTCWQETNAHRVNLMYWSRESAPVTVMFDEVQSQIITAEAGIQEIDFMLRGQEECPKKIILSDESRLLSVRSQIERPDR